MKKFLSKQKVIAAAVAALSASPASAELTSHIDLTNQISKVYRASISRPVGNVGEALILRPRSQGNSSSMNLHAQHSSHASHESHASHGSHRSHYSSS